MALIKCPECNKQISDRVKACPHCGYPLVDEGSNAQEPLQVNVTSIKLNNGKGKSFKKLIIMIVALASIAAFAVILIKKKQKDDYIDRLNTVYDIVIIGASKAETLCNLTQRVWRNCIFEDYDTETNKYTRTAYGYHSDFNVALAALYDDETTITEVRTIKANQITMEFNLEALKKIPSDEFEKVYNTLNDLYNAYMSLTELAISPSGSLQAYSQNVNDNVKKFIESYRLFKMQIPEK
jgi:hypothetical protein